MTTSVLITDEGPHLVETQPEYAGHGDTTIDVTYSSLNYKDALALSGNKGVVRTLPLVPGIDAVGTVDGEIVTVNGSGIGERRHGGMTPVMNIDGEFIIPVPKRFTAEQAAAIGTAGYTVALAVNEIRKSVATGDGPILVTGATGGAGSIAVHLLHQLHYGVIAMTGRVHEEFDYLKGLGADEILDRMDFSEPGKPLQKGRFAGVVDAVGSHVLANAVAQTKWGGTVTAFGNAQGNDLPSSVLPFILRAVRLIGINSVDAPRSLRLKAWELLDGHLDTDLLASITETIGLDGVISAGQEMLEGTRRGRTVINVS